MAESIEGQTSRRRTKLTGRHFTPPALAAFLARLTVDRLPRGRAIEVLDPACGDGNLLSALLDAAPQDQRERLHLTGVELDEKLLEQARARLSGRVPGDFRLSSTDFLESVAIEPDQKELFPVAPRSGERLGNGAFDLIIANPPYVRTQLLGAARSRRIARQLGLTGRVDLYHAFIGAMTLALRPGGILALICSNRFLFTQAGASVRDLFSRHYQVERVIDLGDTRLFDAAVLPAIVVARRGRHRELGPGRFVRVYSIRKPAVADPVQQESVLHALEAGVLGPIRVGRRGYQIEAGELVLPRESCSPWSLASREEWSWLRRIEAATECTFGDVATIHVGIKSTADHVFIRDDWDSLPRQERPEASLLRPLITHHVASPFVASSAPLMRVLYPHAARNGTRAVVDLDGYPRARKYLERHREALSARSYVTEAGRRWYELWVPQDPDGWKRQRIVFPDISEQPRFFLDGSGSVVNGDCYWITLRPCSDSRWLLLMLAVANSSLAARFYDTVCGNRLYAGRRRFITQYVRRFPLMALDTPESETIVQLTRERIETPSGSEAAARIEAALDQLVTLAFA